MQNIFKKFDAVAYFAAMAAVLSIAGVFVGNVIALVIQAAIEVAGFAVDRATDLVTIPIGCALIAAGLAVSERKKAEKEANRKVFLMTQILKIDGRLSDQEIGQFYEGMRGVEIDDTEMRL